MEPATTIIKNLGGPTSVARITGVHRTRVWNWTRPKAKGGTGGTIPFGHVQALLDAARSLGVSLSPADFMPIPSRSEKAS